MWHHFSLNHATRSSSFVRPKSVGWGTTNVVSGFPQTKTRRFIASYSYSLGPYVMQHLLDFNTALVTNNLFNVIIWLELFALDPRYLNLCAVIERDQPPNANWSQPPGADYSLSPRMWGTRRAQFTRALDRTYNGRLGRARSDFRESARMPSFGECARCTIATVRVYIWVMNATQLDMWKNQGSSFSSEFDMFAKYQWTIFIQYIK